MELLVAAFIVVGEITFWVGIIQWLNRRHEAGPRASADGDFETIEDALPFLKFPVDDGAEGTRTLT